MRVCDRRFVDPLAVSFLALSAVFWWDFALPFGCLVGPLLAGLLAVGWESPRIR
jgi:hypothetical protein